MRFHQALRQLVRREVTPLLDQLERDNMPVRWQGAWVSGRRCRRGDLVKLGRQRLDRAARDDRDAGHGFGGRLGNLRRRARALGRAPTRGDVLAADIQRLGRELTELRAEMAAIKGAGA